MHLLLKHLTAVTIELYKMQEKDHSTG